MRRVLKLQDILNDANETYHFLSTISEADKYKLICTSISYLASFKMNEVNDVEYKKHCNEILKEVKKVLLTDI